MKVADLSPELLERIKEIRYDAIREKHEGPWDWEGEFKWGEPEFIHVEGRYVLLPVESEHYPNITILRTIVSDDGNTLILFLQDMTHVSDTDLRYIKFEAGYIAVCEKMSGTEFYIATVYHEWFIIDNPALSS